MPILPIDSGRYGTPEMLRVFEEEARLQRLLEVEAALSWALAELGLIKREDAERIQAMANVEHVKLRRVKEIEANIQHDLMAVVEALAEACGERGAFVHFGATSNDINDTATALQFREALGILLRRLMGFEETLVGLVEAHRATVMVGRTHGQHALPLTLGLKFAVWMMEVSRHIERLLQCRERVLVGKLTGAVGTQAGFGEKGMELQRLVMSRLGLRPVEVSTQIVQRDRYAELLCLLALLASSLDKFAAEIRELQRTEIGELAEPFDAKRQVGSSTMPHKMNPVVSERICGLAKVVRGFVGPALENVPNWQERDLTHSSCERIILPSALILVDYMVHLMDRVLGGLRVDRERIRRNLEMTQGRNMSEAVMLALTRKGVPRQKAHELLREASIASLEKNKPFRDVLLESRAVRAYLDEAEVDSLLKPENYLGTAVKQVDEALAAVKARMGRFKELI